MLVTTGDGTTSEGEFWESLNTASNLKLPVVYLVEDNGYAISVPVEVNTRRRHRSRSSSRSFPDLFIQEVDGCDLLATYEVDAPRRSTTPARGRDRRSSTRRSSAPTRTRCPTTRSCTGRPPSARPTRRATRSTEFPKWLLDEGHRHRGRARSDRERGRRRGPRGDRRCARPAAAGHRARSTTTSTRPTSIRRASSSTPRTIPQFSRATDDDGRPAQRLHEGRDAPRPAHPRLRRGRRRLSAARSTSAEVKGKGGVFKVTWGLQKEFGGDARLQLAARRGEHRRPRDRARARAGFKPVVEIQFFDYIWPAYMQLRDELATMRWRSNNAFAVAGGRAHHVRRLHPRRDLPLADRRVALHALPRPARRLPLHGARRERPAAHRDPLRGPGDLPRAQAPLPPDVQQGAVPGPELHDPVRQGQGRARRDGRHGRDLRRDGAARDCAAAKRAEEEHGIERRGDRPPHALAVGPGDHRASR